MKKSLLMVLVFTAVCFFVSAESLRVMSWNLEDMDIFDGNGMSRVQWQVEAEKKIAEVIKNVNPDILFIPEAPSLVELQYFVRHNGLDYYVIQERQQSGRRSYADGMAVLSRIAPLSAELADPPVPGSGRSPDKAYLDWSFRGLLVVEYSGFTVVGVHLKSPWDGKITSYQKRLAQSEGLLNYIEKINNPVIVLGDFNDSPGLDEKEKLYGLPDTIGLIGRQLERAPGDEPTQQRGYNLDHIFAAKASTGRRHVVETGWDISDHRPVWSDINY